MQTNFPILNSAGSIKHGLFTVRNAASKDKPAEILIYGQIGKDWFSDDGVNAKDFDAALKEIPDGKQINVRINSPGGNVWDGIAIYNMLYRIRDRVTTIGEGLVASIASVVFQAGSKRVIAKGSTVMIHEARGIIAGTADDARKFGDVLDKHDDQIAIIYASGGGKPKEDYRRMMKDETWMNGDEAKANGLVDIVSEDEPSALASTILASLDLSRFRRVPGALLAHISAAVRGGATHENTQMNKAQIIALLKKQGIDVLDNVTDEALLALLEQATNKAKEKPAATGHDAEALATMQAALKASNEMLNRITADRENERKARITGIVNKAVEENRLPAAESEEWIANAIKDETPWLKALAARPAVTPPEPIAQFDVTAEDPKEIGKAIMKLWGNAQTPENAMARARKRAQIITAQHARLMPFLNAATSTNTVDAALKLNVILQQFIRAFAIKIMPLNAFSTILNARNLLGTDKVEVPYFPLITTTSIDFNQTNGYDTAVNSNASKKEVTVNKRKYQLLTWNSSEFQRQPFLNTGKNAMLAAEQLGLDVVNDVLSIVLPATYTNTPITAVAGGFSSDNVADLKGICDLANWPGGGRSLLLNSAYDVALLKDPGIKLVYAFGDNGPIRDGRITRLVGFDYYPDARIPANAVNLQGFAVYQSAVLFAQSQVEPTAEVRQQLTRYEVVIDPETNASLEYRLWGDPEKDTSKEVIECNYGYAAGEVAALTCIVSP